MTTIVAVSVSDQIEKFGAYAGFAAVIGLAVLSLLYFAQARETKRLREWASSRPPVPEPRPVQQRVVPQPVGTPSVPAANQSPSAPATPAAQGVKPPGAPPGAPAAPAVAAQAGSAAVDQPTEIHPAPAQPVVASSPAAPPATPAAAEGPALATPASSPSTKAPTSGEDQRTIVTPAPAARPLRASTPSAVAPRVPAGRPGGPGDRSKRRRGGGRDDGGKRRSRARALVPIGAGLVALLAAAVALSGVLGGGSENEPDRNVIATPTTETAGTTTTGGNVDRSSVTVAVLNGTTVSGLARGIANDIEAGGFRLGAVDNAADQTRSATSIEYLAGSEPAAQDIARLIRTNSDSVIPMTNATQVLAPNAQVVVTVGADQSPTG
jgi:hypothetical protein